MIYNRLKASSLFRTDSLSDIGPFKLELAEVIDIILDESHDFFKLQGEWNSIGKIKIRFLNDKNKKENLLLWAKPFFSNIKQYPLLHEVVLVGKFIDIEDAEMSKNSSDSQMDYYYFGALNTLNGINNNALRNISFSDEGSKDIELGKTFASKDITALYLNEGDTVFEGRFGSSIRLGSNNGECENPNIVIRNGTFSEDKVFDFESFEKNKSIALFSSVDSIEIPLSKSTTDTLSDFPKIFDGEQIIINTDRAVINTNENEIIFSSNKDIGLLAKKEIGIDGEKKVHIKAKKIIIGDETRSEPIVKGEQLKMIISELIDEISNIKVSVPSAPGISGPPLNAIKLGLIKKKLSKMLSKHKVE